MAGDALVGQRFDGRYELLNVIGSGAFSAVYEAIDHHNGTSVAVKVLKPGAPSSGLLEFDTEGRLLRHLTKSTHVVDILDSGVERYDIPMPSSSNSMEVLFQYHVLELAEACLTHLLAYLSQISWEDRLTLFRGVVKGAHQSQIKGVLNRDYKSENVLLFQDGKAAISKVSDYGRGRLDSAPDRFGPDDYVAGRGDLRFAPPELLFCAADTRLEGWRRVELYLLGSVMFEIATGVGITGMIFGDPLRHVRNAQQLTATRRLTWFTQELPGLQARYELAYATFEASVPPAIQYEASRLLRILTAPEPSRRTPSRIGTGPTDGLNWILTRIDIMSLALRQATRQAHRLAARKRRTAERRSS